MKTILILLLISVGDCVILTKGVFKDSYWLVTAVNDDGTYDLKDKDWTLPKVRSSYVAPADKLECREN